MSTPFFVLTEAMGSQAIARHALAVLERAGYVCVPKTATPKMLEDAYWAIYGEKGDEAWDEMIKSALTTQAEENSAG